MNAIIGILAGSLLCLAAIWILDGLFKMFLVYLILSYRECKEMANEIEWRDR